MFSRTQPMRQRIVVPFTGHVIGEGFNSETVERVGTALSVDRIGEDPVAPGQRAFFKFLMLTSQASLEKSLNLGAEIEARYALFSAGGKFSFAENSAINSTSTYILASCVVTNALRFGSGFHPNEAAKSLIDAGDKDGFKRAFGDRFTQALHTGGEFHALVRVTSSHIEHQQKIAASLHAELNGLFTSGSFKGSLETAQKDSSAHTEVDIQIHQTGGVGDQIQIPGTDADRLRDHMNHFASAAHTNAAAFEAELLTYDTLALPFPTADEIEDRRRVLEDCLARRQVYWSAISDLTFAQSEDAPLIFQDLPSREELLALQNAFRSILNDLMAHARQVSSGAIEPTFFVAENEPVLPHFRRRTAGTFSSWWARAKSNDPGLLRDEQILIDQISTEAAPFLTVPVGEASPESMERAANLIEKLHLENIPLHSLASLPRMIDAPLRKIWAQDTELEDLTGLEGFSRLEFLLHDFGKLRDIQAIASLAGLLDLRLRGNEISDLSAISALTSLETLCIQGNNIRSLDPLRTLPALGILVIASEDFSASVGAPDSFGFLDNPVTDAQALGQLPRLVCPLTSAEQLKIRIFGDQGELRQSGVATRIGHTNRFQFHPEDGSAGEQVLLAGLREWGDLNIFPSPVIVSTLHFANQGMGLACTQPEDRSASLPATDVIDLFFSESDFSFDVGIMINVSPVTGLPDLILEVEPAL